MAEILSYSNNKDYTGVKVAAQSLALQIQDWWHSRGFLKVKVWVDTIPVYGNNGDVITRRFDIRSNIYTDVEQIKVGNSTK